MLHCGANAVNREDLGKVETPSATKSWQPIRHDTLLSTVESALQREGLRIFHECHALGKNGDRYFGLLQIIGHPCAPDYAAVLGLRNSHDKSLPSGIVAGTSVFVCDNLCFSGEIKLQRKHTPMIWRDLPELARTAVDRLVHNLMVNDSRIDRYKSSLISDVSAHHLIIRSMDESVITPRQLPHVLDEWRSPRHEAFQARNLWSLQNAFTEVLKGRLINLPRSTARLQHLLDHHAGFTAN